METKPVAPSDFRTFGYLQEVNRLVLHPLGLALVAEVEETSDGEIITRLSVMDHRDDPEGIIFDDSLVKSPDFRQKAKAVHDEWFKRAGSRAALIHAIIQSVPGGPLSDA